MTIEPKSGKPNSRNARGRALRLDRPAKLLRESTTSRREPNYESGGREFESLRARQKSNKYLNNLTARKYAMQNKIICMASAWPRGARAIGPGRAVAAARTLLSIQCVEALYFLPAALVTTDAPFAGNVERKVSNHRARFYAADHSWIVRNWRRYHHDVTAIRQCNRFAGAAPQIRYRGISDVSLRFESYQPP